jgi:hypothetical protein
MTLAVVGAGLGRTGTHSLKIALEQLLDAPCYHMFEVREHPDDVALWQRAMDGELPDWNTLFARYRATVDWPTAAFWRELAVAYPDAIVLLSVREPDDWWTSANRTIFEVVRGTAQRDGPDAAQLKMATDMLERRFTPGWSDETTAKAAYVRHNDEVRATIAADRLVEWRPGDGWAPLCAALRLPEPDAPFPHVNTAQEFRSTAGLDAGG